MSLPLPFPEFSAILNSASAIFVVLGLWSIHKQAKDAHKKAMLGAVFFSILFLANYLWYHLHYTSPRFAGQGWIRPTYFFMLISHVTLAAVTPIFVGVMLYFAYKENWIRHKAWGKWVVPVWIYTSVTGVLVYFFVYQWFKAAV